MKIKTEKYLQANEIMPKEGQYIIGHQSEDEIVVYQAYKPSIADYAVKHQIFGGSEYGYGRMSWIKPNFLWMMYRCGWAEKENQERVLAIWIKKKTLEDILSQAVLSSFNPRYYKDRDVWKEELDNKEVRLQWDPDHDPYGEKISRRAIQLGLKGTVLQNFGKGQISAIEDVTDYVRQQKKHVDSHRLDLLEVPVERVWYPQDKTLGVKIGMTL
ncbi:MAG: DUF4291 domain-containing protein [Chitinophagaceae bacterium]|nr:DUF4291 domain-containing protein [Chitinophagaceae bacterium]